MSGFVYIWRDRKHKRFYIGSHWGTPDDGYICSSSWMKRAYKLRPTDFRRRILSLVFTNRQDLFEEEEYWLRYVKDQELGKKYYNLIKETKHHWACDPEKTRLIGEKRRRSQDDVIAEFKSTHGDFYDYSQVVYKNNKTKVRIGCPLHGWFEQPPSKHYRSGCNQCGNAKISQSKTKNKEWFLEEATKVHGSRYDYSRVRYVGTTTDVEIVCSVHGIFEQTPSAHIRKQGCPKCGISKRALTRTKPRG